MISLSYFGFGEFLGQLVGNLIDFIFDFKLTSMFLFGSLYTEPLAPSGSEQSQW